LDVADTLQGRIKNARHPSAWKQNVRKKGSIIRAAIMLSPLTELLPIAK